MTRLDKTRHVMTRQDKTRQDKGMQESLVLSRTTEVQEEIRATQKRDPNFGGEKVQFKM